MPCRRATFENYNQLLSQYMQQPPDAMGRRLSHIRISQWRLWNSAQSFCDAFTQQPSESLDRAQACLSYIQVVSAYSMADGVDGHYVASSQLVFCCLSFRMLGHKRSVSKSMQG